MENVYLKRLYVKPDIEVDRTIFPMSLPFALDLDLEFNNPVTFFVGENGSGKSTLLEAIAQLCGLPVGGGGRNELADFSAPHATSELAPYLRAGFKRKPRDGYFFRAEFHSHFASLLDQRKADPDFWGDPYARYGGRSLHTRSHGEAFLAMFSAWMSLSRRYHRSANSLYWDKWRILQGGKVFNSLLQRILPSCSLFRMPSCSVSTTESSRRHRSATQSTTRLLEESSKTPRSTGTISHVMTKMANNPLHQRFRNPPPFRRRLPKRVNGSVYEK